jgi:uncharacterized protein YjbI with pentapeptide repeats
VKRSGLSQLVIVALVAAVLLISGALVYQSQVLAERDAFSPIPAATSKEQFELAKLAAEIRQIRSDTSGSLFWLKVIGLFVTVGGAVGGYLVAQSQATRARLAFEDRQRIDSAYQGIVQELAAGSPLLRAAAAVKLGSLLKSFPHEWNVDDARRAQLVELTKRVLAAALAIETDQKVLKTLTIALASYPPAGQPGFQPAAPAGADLREIDLSRAHAADAYWARVDFTYADFYGADLTKASLRKAVLRDAQFREATLRHAVLAGADCTRANFELADLRGADLSGATLSGARFTGARVAGAVIGTSVFGASPDARPSGQVDLSTAGDGSALVDARDWLAGERGEPTA